MELETPYSSYAPRVRSGAHTSSRNWWFGTRRLPLEIKLRRKIEALRSTLARGGTFALGWTPCVGPVLASILLLASTTATALQGAILLSVFSLGLAVPFILIALMFARATKYIGRILHYLKWVSIVGGVFLIMLGILLITNNFGLMIQYGYQLFDFVNYGQLLNYL